MEAMSVKMKNIRQKSIGSLKIKIPKITVPTAPIPDQTAYDVPRGSVWLALMSKSILMLTLSIKPRYQRYMVVPDASFAFPIQNVKRTSKSPPMISKIQFIFSEKLI